MTSTPRILCVAALCVAFASLAPAQQSAPQDIPCNPTLVSEGAAPAACAALSEAAGPVAAARLVDNAQSFGHDFQNSAFVRLEEDRPGTYMLVAPLNPDEFINAGDFRGNDLTTWYGLDAVGRAFSVDANTGVITSLGRIDPPEDFTWTALTWDYEDEVFYALGARCGSRTGLFEVDFDRLRRTQVAAPNQGFLCGIALASDPVDGTLYAYGLNRNELGTINKNNGAVTIVGALDFDPNFGQGMDFSNIDGTLYAYAYNNDPQRGELRAVDTSSGSTTFIGRLGGIIPGGRNQIGSGSSRTPRNAYSLSASTAAQSVPQGGSARVSFQVCNGLPAGLSGDLTYRFFLDGSPASPEVRVGSGSVGARTCLREISFDAEVASDAQPGTYRVDLTVTPDGPGPARTVSLLLDVTASATLSANTWGVSNADSWLTRDGQTAASASAAPAEVSVYPNPFAGETALTFSLGEAAEVRLAVYDVLGREVAVLTEGTVEAGTHTATLDARGLATGTYVYRLVADGLVKSGRLTLVQ
ncbi:MAG: T9SS type A sorting domain-containing protein [Bacteroidota bacterium]